MTHEWEIYPGCEPIQYTVPVSEEHAQALEAILGPPGTQRIVHVNPDASERCPNELDYKGEPVG